MSARVCQAIAITLTLGQACLVEGQNFQRRYDAWGDLQPETGFGIEHTTNGYVVIAAASYIVDSFIYNSVVTTLHIDNDGMPLDTNAAFIPGKATYPGIVNVGTIVPGGFVVGGGTLDTLGVHRPTLYLFDSTGVVLSIIEYGDSTEDWLGRQGKPTPDGGYVICGETISASPSYDAFLLKIDSTGAQEWIQVYGFPNRNEFAFTVDIAPDEGYYIGGQYAPVLGNYDQWVLRVDAAGNLLWDEGYGGPFSDPSAHIETAANGDVLMASSWALNGGGALELGLMRLDSTGATVWSERYDGNAADGGFFVVKEIGPQLDLIAAGTSYKPGYRHGALLRTNSQGDSLWLRYYHYYDSIWTEGKGLFRDVITTNDGGFIAAGVAYGSNNPGDPPIYSQDTWVVKVDSMGCLVPGCDGISTITTQITNYRDALRVAPNPAHNLVQLQWQLPQALTGRGAAQLSVVDAQSRVVRTEPLDLPSGTHELDVSALAPGLYHLHVVQNGVWITGAKLMVE